ncbi:MAG: amidohydrolase family protein [Acidobacteria bacterium]|nr:amidohydrolase family protein [Acidobacteriota bacterium]
MPPATTRPLVLLCLSGALWGQSLSGVVDIHVHSDPDSVPRSIDAIDIAKLARAKGLRALLLKNHYEPTASLAYLVRKEVPGIELYGGIALNRTVGGINPAAVERMTRVRGGWGRVVWMPTFDAENQVRFSKENRPFVSVSRLGQVLPEVREVLAIMGRAKLALATGHSTPSENLMLIRAAREAGIERIVVTHAMLAPVGMSVEQMQDAARLGAYLEFVYNALIGPNKSFTPAEYARAIRAVGPEHCILSSDLGQAGNPLHPDGLEAFFGLLRAEGFGEAEIERMAKTNPARLLGL